MPGRTGGGGATAAMCTTHRGAHNPTRCRGTDDSKQPCDDCCCYNRHHDDSPTNTCPMQQVACWTLSSVHVDVATAQPVAQALVPLMQGPWAAWLAGALRALVASALSEPRALVTLAHAGLRVFEAACRCVFLSVVFAHSLHTSDNHVMLFARVMMTTMGLICQSCLSLHAHQAARVLCGAAPKPTRTARHRPHPRPRGRPPSPRRPRPRPPPRRRLGGCAPRCKSASARGRHKHGRSVRSSAGSPSPPAGSGGGDPGSSGVAARRRGCAAQGGDGVDGVVAV